MDELTKLLNEVKSTAQKRDKANKKTFNLEWQFGIGRSTNALTLDKVTGESRGNFSHEHNLKKGVGVWMGDVKTSTRPLWQKELYKVATELLMLIDAHYAGDDGDYSVNFSCMSDPKQHYVHTHTDSKDIAYQYGLVLGECSGGNLTTYLSNGDTQTLDYRRKVLKMDGRLAHEVAPFAGRRYSVIFYKSFDRRYSRELPVFEPAVFV